MASNSFQRSPSKVWWAQGLEENSHSDWHNRPRNGSPSSHKSQDSGFSDSEISPPVGVNSKRTQDSQPNSTPKRLFSTEKVLKESSLTPKKNLTENITEKFSVKKNLLKHLTDDDTNTKSKKGQRIYERHNPCCRSLPSTPKNQNRNFSLTSKSTSQVPSPNHSPKLFHSKRLTLFNGSNDEQNIHNTINNEEQESSSDNSSLKVNRNLMQYFPKDQQEDKKSVTLPLVPVVPNIKNQQNVTVPLYYQYNLDKIEYDYTENITTTTPESTRNNSDTELSSSSSSILNDSSNEVLSSESFNYEQHNPEASDDDCEKEIESFFPDNLDKLEPPTHTSTPKTNLKKNCLSPLRKRIVKHRRCTNLTTTIERIPETNPLLLPQLPPVQCWLNEVGQMYEPECMTTLQSKSIANDLGRKVSEMSDKLTMPIKNMLHHSRIIMKEFNKIKSQIQKNKSEHLAPLSQSLVGNITEFVLKNMVNSQASSLVESKQTKGDIHNLLEVSTNLRQATMSSKPKLDEVYTLLIKLQDLFYTTECNILALQIQLLVNTIEETISHLSLRGVLFGLTSLALQCERLSDLIVKSGGPRALLLLCVECKASTIRTMALRTLATICCTTTAIRQLEQGDGVEILADILSDSSRPEPELSEATSVLAQITAPWIEDNHTVKGLTENTEILITAITDFLQKTNCCQNLLLCSAALANITYMNTKAINSLIENDTVTKLLNAVRNRGPRASVFLKEQTATLIANLSDIPEARQYLADNNTGVALLCFLQIFPIHIQGEAEMNAAQRLQQKSAIALSRLCSDSTVAHQIVDLGGVTRLVQLCKEGKERNNSDAVLVACLATLRKIVANCGNEVMDQKDINELVEPRLLDSFLAYSAQNESYV